MSSSADFNRNATAPSLFPEDAPETSDWKDEVNRRLAAHRNRQHGSERPASMHARERAASGSRAAQAAARVAARYANAPTYQDLLEGNAEAVVLAADAAVEAARGAQAVATAVLAGLQARLPLETLPPSQTDVRPQSSTPSRWPEDSRWLDEPLPSTVPQIVEHAQPRWHDAIPCSAPGDVWAEMRVSPMPEHNRPAHNQMDARLLHDDDSMAEATMAEATVEPVQATAANLIQFPRELVAARKARPQLAEQPFTPLSGGPQVSIFEVDPSTLPTMTQQPTVPEWTKPNWSSLSSLPQQQHWQESTFTEAETRAGGNAQAETHIDPEFALRRLPQIKPEDRMTEEPPAETILVTAEASVLPIEPPQTMPHTAIPTVQQTEPMELFVAGQSHRLLAGIVDAALVALAFLASATVVLAATDQPPSDKTALLATGIGLVLFALAYQMLFFAFSAEGTPGMRYARIALCTFDDNNPNVKQSLLRIPATLVAVLPLGLGLLWSFVDRRGLGLHDRLSKTYPRKY